MKRKEFLGSSAAAVAGLAWPGTPQTESLRNRDSRSPILPPYLKNGDTIAITSPAGYITVEEIQPAIQLLENWGFRTRIGDSIGKRDFSLGGSDQERASDFQQLLDDQTVSAILCARGGYGAVRIIDKLKWEHFKKQPKWIIGFSDITVFHSHINRNLSIASIHSKMCNSFPAEWSRAEPIQAETIVSIHKALRGESGMHYPIVTNLRNRTGHASGVLVGGNCKTLESLAGSSSDIVTDDKILFVEDTGEYMYSIDRMFWNLKRSGKLSQLAGLIIGGFKVRADDPGEEFGRTLEDIVLEKVAGYDYPVCFDFPVGHQKSNYALKCGVKHKLNVQQQECTLTELT